MIQSARQRPDHHKKIIAFCGSAAITLVIFAGWAVTLPGQWAGLSSPVPAQSQPAAAELSVVTPSDSANTASPTSATQILQQNFNQGVQFLDSFKNSLGDLISGHGPSYGTAPATAALSTPAPVSVETPPSNPYSNLKYYVSHGVLISNPTKN